MKLFFDYKMKIAYLGPERTFTEQIARDIFPEEMLIPISPIKNVIKAVEKNKVDFGVVPIENFYNGEVMETLDSLTESSNVKVVMEKYLEIVHCLGVLPEHKKIKQIMSKNQALEQCSDYIYKKFPDAVTIPVSSTAEAVEMIKKENKIYAAAVASEKAIKDAGLKILDKDLCPKNKTRFVVLGKITTKPSSNDKTFLVIHPHIDKPGILFNCLKFFNDSNINLNSIQSRPDKNKGYYFYIELEGHEQDKSVSKCIENMRSFLDSECKYPDAVKILGSYPNTHWKDED